MSVLTDEIREVSGFHRRAGLCIYYFRTGTWSIIRMNRYWRIRRSQFPVHLLRKQNNKWEYYVNEIHEMDNFVKELTDKLADYPEDVVLVMYGDHLPTMGLTVEDLKNKYLFQTEYVMWDNFGLKKKNENLAAYQMAAEVMDRVGIHEGTVFRYHQARRNTRNYQVDLETLQYDLLYGKRYSYGESGESPYLRTRMRMGIYDVTLDSIQCIV